MPVRIAITKKAKNKWWLRCGEKETLIHSGWDYKLAQGR